MSGLDFLALVLQSSNSFHEFAPASISPVSVSDHDAINKDFTKVDHLQTAFARSNFSTVISATMFFFRFTFYYLGAIIHSFSFLDAVVCFG